MTPEHLKSIMERQNLSNLDLAAIVGVTDRQVRSWLTGAFRIPHLVSIFLLAMDEGIIPEPWLVEKIEIAFREMID